MSLLDMVIVGAAAFIGWWLVSWFFDAFKPKPTQELPEQQAPLTSGKPAATPVSPRLSLMELGERWRVILGVPAEASEAEIESACRAALEACDRELLSNASVASRRQEIEAAYEFIRKARKGAQ